MEFNTQNLIESRLKVADLRNSIRVIKNNIEKTRFRVEMESIKSVDGNYGKNAEERERFLQSAINESSEYVRMEDELISLQNSLEVEEAKIESLRDLRRELEMILKEKVIDSNINFE
jgi:hypothetical protein